MDINGYFKSLASEVDSLKNRVRHLIDDRHWLTDGEWKESVIRQILRRHLPSSATVGRGFVVTPAWASHQIDVLIYNSAKPVLFRDGDLVFVTPDAVYGVIEVKTRATRSVIAEAARKLAKDMVPIREAHNSKAFCGIFAFENGSGQTKSYLDAVHNASESWNSRIDFVSCGKSRFIKYWHFNPRNEAQLYQGWHSYSLPGTSARVIAYKTFQ